MTPCPAENTLLQFVAGGLPAEQADAVLSHTDGCLTCRALLLEVARQPAGLSRPPPQDRARGAAPQPWTPPDQIEEYRLLRPLGHGAMGQVYIAQDTRLDRPVAIKLIAAQEPDRAARDRFFVEARAIARLTHPNIVGVYRVGEVQDRPYLVSEYVRGQSLDQLPLPLPDRRLLAIALGLSRGLAAAHRRGVLHRDIKPANAILADDGEVKLLDFGLAKLLDPAQRPALAEPALAPDLDALSLGATSPAPLTRTGTLLGTPMYMAPERWRGEPATRQADVYSLGALLYELASGHPPHQAASIRELSRRIQEQDAQPLGEAAPGTDTRLADLVDRCLQRQPAERFASGEELHHALGRLQGGVPSQAAPSSAPYRGLLPFELQHRGVFFGRSAEVQAVVERLRAGTMVLVAGDSGVGKSSLCRAGVMAQVMGGALGEERPWVVASLVPGRHPAQGLADALALASGLDAAELLALLHRQPDALVRRLRQQQEGRAGVLLFIDQMEDCTLSAPEEAAAVGELLGLLSSRQPGLRVLLTARGDHLTRLAVLPGIGDDLSRAPLGLPAERPDLP